MQVFSPSVTLPVTVVWYTVIIEELWIQEEGARGMISDWILTGAWGNCLL